MTFYTFTIGKGRAFSCSAPNHAAAVERLRQRLNVVFDPRTMQMGSSPL